MKLSSSVSILPLQSPMVHAKAWSTLDWLTNGRAEALFGVGWLKEEFDMMHVSFEKRGKMADASLAAIIALWNQAKPEFEGAFVSFTDIGFAPKPPQSPSLPTCLTAAARAVLKDGATIGDDRAPL